jgi:hypothetical protein
MTDIVNAATKLKGGEERHSSELVSHTMAPVHCTLLNHMQQTGFKYNDIRDNRRIHTAVKV